MTEHTPTPWMTMHQFVSSSTGPVPIAPSFHDYVTSPGGSMHEEAVANAAFIVKACNSHDALVKALRTATNWMLCDNEFGDPEQFKTDLAEIKSLLGVVGNPREAGK